MDTVFDKLVQYLANKKTGKAFLIAGMLLFSSFPPLFSQTRYSNPDRSVQNYSSFKTGWFLGLDAGSTLFYGDIALYNNFPKFKDINVSAGRAFSIMGGKKFNYGLAAEAQLFKGTLKGEKRSMKLYPRYFNAEITGYSISARYNLSQLLFREKSQRSFFNRITLYANVGCGQVFFRSRLYKYASNNQWYLENVSGFSSKGIDSAGLSSAGGLVTDKAKIMSAVTLPIGGKVSFKLNSKTNIILDVNYVTVFSDEVDAWVRSWSHKDRYLYTGIGFVFNFGEDNSSDIPDSDRLFNPRSKKKKSGDAGIDTSDNRLAPSGSGAAYKKGIFKKREKTADKDLEIKLKLYELQLKLFEMQYLIN